MKIKIRADQMFDVQPGDLFEVVSFEGTYITLQRVYRPKSEQPPTLGVSVSDGLGVGESVGG